MIWLRIGIPLALVLAVLWFRHEAHQWHKIADTFEAARNADHAAYKAAQKAAEAQQIAADLATEATYSAIAKESVHEHRNAMEAVSGAADRYAAAHPVRVPAIQVCRSSSGTEPAGLPADPQAPTDASQSADMVAVTREDLDRLSGASLQAAERGNYLQSLIDEGLALPAVNF